VSSQSRTAAERAGPVQTPELDPERTPPIVAADHVPSTWARSGGAVSAMPVTALSAEAIVALQRTRGNQAVTRTILARNGPHTPTRQVPMPDIQAEGEPAEGMPRDAQLFEHAWTERERVGTADADFKRNVAVIKFERDGQVHYLAAANQGELHAEEVLVGKLGEGDPELRKVKILEVYSEREPCWRCRRLLRRWRQKQRYDFPIHHSVPTQYTYGKRARTLRGLYVRAGHLAPGPPSATVPVSPSPRIRSAPVSELEEIGAHLRTAVVKVRARVARGRVRGVARAAARAAIRLLPIVFVLLTLKSAKADVEAARENAENLRSLRPRVEEDGLDRLPSATELATEHLKGSAEHDVDYLEQHAILTLLAYSIGRDEKSVRAAVSMVGQSLTVVHERATSIIELDAVYAAYTDELDALTTEAKDRYDSLQSAYSRLEGDLRRFENLGEWILETILTLHQAVEAVMRAVGQLEARLELTRNAYVEARQKYRTEWFELVHVYNAFAPQYDQAVRIRGGLPLDLRPLESDDIDR
jgi:Xanthomonas XOO_2897-like deaminase